MAQFGFDISDVEVNPSFELLPPGEYRLSCLEAEVKDTKRGDGQYISATFEVIGKPGRIWHNFNIHNPNPKAEEIGRQQIAAWARSCGKPNARDTDELIECQFNAKVDVESREGYSDKNVIKAFLFEKTATASKAQTVSKPATATPAEEPKNDSKPARATKNPWD